MHFNLAIGNVFWYNNKVWVKRREIVVFSHRLSYRDALVSAVVLLIALLLLAIPLMTTRAGEWLVVITPEETFSYPLSRDTSFEVSSRGITLYIMIEGGAAFVKESNCPDGVCIASHAVSKNGETILCAPAGVTLTVRGGDGDVDHVAG